MNFELLLDHFDRIVDAPDAIPRFREFALDLAVRGKLVEQNPNDEPASELLQRIQLEKARLVREGKVRKQELTLPVESQDRPFELPASWEWVRFGRIADFSAGRTPSRHDFSFWNTGDYPWVSIADMKDGGDVVTTKETISLKAKNQIFRSEPAPVGTLIMSFKLTIGKISKLGIPAFHNEAIISIHPFLPAMIPYLYKVLPQFSKQGNTKDAIKGETLNRDSIASILLPLPPLAEQDRIVLKADELMALCERLEALREERETRRDRLSVASHHHLNNGADAAAFRPHANFYLDHFPRLTTRPAEVKQLRQTILNLAVRGRLVPQDQTEGFGEDVAKLARQSKQRICEEWNFRIGRPLAPIGTEEIEVEIPTTWCWERIGNIAAVKGGKRVPRGVKFSPVPTPHVYIRVTDMKNQTVSLEDLRFLDETTHKQLSRYIIESTDLYVVIVGATIGKVGIIPDELHRMHLTENAAKLVFSDIDRSFLLLALQSRLVQSQFMKKTNQQAQPKLALIRIESTLIPIPPLAEQCRIVAKVNELMRLCDRLERQLTTSQAERSRLLEAVLHQALAGTA